MAQSTYTPGVTTAQALAQTFRGLLGTHSRASGGFTSRPVNLRVSAPFQPIASRAISISGAAVSPTQPSDPEASTPSERDDVLYIPRQQMGRTGRFNNAEQERATVAEEHSSSQIEQGFSANTSGKLYKPCLCTVMPRMR